MTQCSRDRTAWQAHQIRNWADRLAAGHHVGRCGRKKRVSIEEVGPAEHVKQHRARRRELGARPGADFGELVLVEIAENGIEVAGGLLPGRILGQRGGGGGARWRHPRKKTGRIVSARYLRAGPIRPRKDNCARDKRSNSSFSEHLSDTLYCGFKKEA